MSRFGCYEKEEIVEAIKAFANLRKENDLLVSEIVVEIMEAVTAGLSEVLYEK